MRNKWRFGYRGYLLGVLLTVLAFNGVDRLALGLLLQDIKIDLNLSDTELGLMTGIAFALFYSTAGIPIARWADRGNRVLIISVTTALGGVMVALCGAAINFVHLLLIRIGVAVGEAGCVPVSHSLIADYFDRVERPRAVAIYMLGSPLSVLIGYFVAGWLNEQLGWRMTFVVLGVPSVLFAVLVLTLREPRRARGARVQIGTDSDARPATVHVSMGEIFITLWRNRTFRNLALYFSIASFFSAGLLTWQPAFLRRSHGIGTAELGMWLALIQGGGGLVGTYLGGLWASRRAANNEPLQLRTIAGIYACFSILMMFAYLSPNQYVAFVLMALALSGGAAANGPLFAIIQALAPTSMRAMSVALMYLFANLIGLGAGPLAIGLLSDFLQPTLGDDSLRMALLLFCPGYGWAAWHLWCASRSVGDDMQTTQAASASA